MIEIADSATICDPWRRLSARELKREASNLARSLRARGVRPGDRILISAPKSIELVALILAAWKAGAVVVAPYHGLSSRQLRHIVSDAAPSLAVLMKSPPSGAWDTVDGTVPTAQYADLAGDDGPELPEPHKAPPHDPALLIYTSGSTGLPKGVVFTNENLALGAESVAEYFDLRPSDHVLCLLPFSFDAGLNQLLSTLVAGGTAHLRDFVFPHHVVNVCREQRITVLTGVPALWRKLAKASWPDDARVAMRCWASTGSHMSIELSGQLSRIFPNASPILMYGFTEAFRGSYLPPAMFRDKPTSIGVPIPHSALAVVGPDGALCMPYEVGELVQFGPLVSDGYWRQPEETRKKFAPLSDRTHQELVSREAAFRVPREYLGRIAWSGDRAFVDEEGCFYFEGRASSLIKSQGFRVSPTEVENACLETGLLEDVVAIGVERNGEEEIAIVGQPARPEVDAGDLREALKPILPSYQVPGIIVLRDDLPLTPSGKHDLEELRREMMQVAEA